MEEVCWYQKSQVKWLTCENRNTKIFHLSTIIRWKRNKIESLKDNDDRSVDDPNALKDMALRHYLDLDTLDGNVSGSFMVAGLSSMTDEVRTRPEKQFTDKEMHGARRETGALKPHDPMVSKPYSFIKPEMLPVTL